jgi:hypothetical protein
VHLVPLLSFIVHKQKARKVNPKRERKEGLRDGYQRKAKGIFIALEASRGYSNGHPISKSRSVGSLIGNRSCQDDDMFRG